MFGKKLKIYDAYIASQLEGAKIDDQTSKRLITWNQDPSDVNTQILLGNKVISSETNDSLDNVNLSNVTFGTLSKKKTSIKDNVFFLDKFNVFLIKELNSNTFAKQSVNIKGDSSVVSDSELDLKNIFDNNMLILSNLNIKLVCFDDHKTHNKNIYTFFESMKILYNLYNIVYVHRENFLELKMEYREEIWEVFGKKKAYKKHRLFFKKRKFFKSQNLVQMAIKENILFKEQIQFVILNFIQLTVHRVLMEIRTIKKNRGKEFFIKTINFRENKLHDFWVVVLESIPIFNKLILKLFGEKSLCYKKLLNSLKEILKYNPDAFLRAFTTVYNQDLAKKETFFINYKFEPSKQERRLNLEFQKKIYVNKTSHEKEVLNPSNLTLIFDLISYAGFLINYDLDQKNLKAINKEIDLCKTQIEEVKQELSLLLKFGRKNETNNRGIIRYLKGKIDTFSSAIKKLEKELYELLNTTKPNPTKQIKETLNSIFGFYVKKRHSWLILRDYLNSPAYRLEYHYSKFKKNQIFTSSIFLNNKKTKYTSAFASKKYERVLPLVGNHFFRHGARTFPFASQSAFFATQKKSVPSLILRSKKRVQTKAIASLHIVQSKPLLGPLCSFSSAKPKPNCFFDIKNYKVKAAKRHFAEQKALCSAKGQKQRLLCAAVNSFTPVSEDNCYSSFLDMEKLLNELQGDSKDDPLELSIASNDFFKYFFKVCISNKNYSQKLVDFCLSETGVTPEKIGFCNSFAPQSVQFFLPIGLPINYEIANKTNMLANFTKKLNKIVIENKEQLLLNPNRIPLVLFFSQGKPLPSNFPSSKSSYYFQIAHVFPLFTMGMFGLTNDKLQKIIKRGEEFAFENNSIYLPSQIHQWFDKQEVNQFKFDKGLLNAEETMQLKKLFSDRFTEISTHYVFILSDLNLDYLTVNYQETTNVLDSFLVQTRQKAAILQVYCYLFLTKKCSAYFEENVLHLTPDLNSVFFCEAALSDFQIVSNTLYETVENLVKKIPASFNEAKALSIALKVSVSKEVATLKNRIDKAEKTALDFGKNYQVLLKTCAGPSPQLEQAALKAKNSIKNYELEFNRFYTGQTENSLNLLSLVYLYLLFVEIYLKQKTYISNLQTWIDLVSCFISEYQKVFAILKKEFPEDYLKLSLGKQAFLFSNSKLLTSVKESPHLQQCASLNCEFFNILREATFLEASLDSKEAIEFQVKQLKTQTKETASLLHKILANYKNDYNELYYKVNDFVAPSQEQKITAYSADSLSVCVQKLSLFLYILDSIKRFEHNEIMLSKLVKAFTDQIHSFMLFKSSIVPEEHTASFLLSFASYCITKGIHLQRVNPRLYYLIQIFLLEKQKLLASRIPLTEESFFNVNVEKLEKDKLLELYLNEVPSIRQLRPLMASLKLCFDIKILVYTASSFNLKEFHEFLREQKMPALFVSLTLIKQDSLQTKIFKDLLKFLKLEKISYEISQTDLSQHKNQKNQITDSQIDDFIDWLNKEKINKDLRVYFYKQNGKRHLKQTAKEERIRSFLKAGKKAEVYLHFPKLFTREVYKNHFSDMLS